MVPRGGHRLNEPVVGETGGREGGGPDPLHPAAVSPQQHVLTAENLGDHDFG